MANLVLQTINETEVGGVVDMLRASDVYEDRATCALCARDIGTVGGLLPEHGKVAPICDSLTCIIQASYAVMKRNGNGSPVVEM